MADFTCSFVADCVRVLNHCIPGAQRRSARASPETSVCLTHEASLQFVSLSTLNVAHFTCRGTWARVTIDKFRPLAMQTLIRGVWCLLIYYQHSCRDLHDTPVGTLTQAPTPCSIPTHVAWSIVKAKQNRAHICPGRKPPFWAVKRLRAHTKAPHKNDLELLTVGNAKGA